MSIRARAAMAGQEVWTRAEILGLGFDPDDPAMPWCPERPEEIEVDEMPRPERPGTARPAQERPHHEPLHRVEPGDRAVSIALLALAAPPGLDPMQRLVVGPLLIRARLGDRL